jgi:hypothetical protein
LLFFLDNLPFVANCILLHQSNSAMPRSQMAFFITRPELDRPIRPNGGQSGSGFKVNGVDAPLVVPYQQGYLFLGMMLPSKEALKTTHLSIK